MRIVIFFCLAAGFASSVIACGSGDDTNASPLHDGGLSEAGSSDGNLVQDASPLGSAVIDGDGGFGVFTVMWSDPGPFNGKPRIEITISDDPACLRKACSNYHELWIRLSGQSGASSVGPGRYSVILNDSGPLAGFVEGKLGYQTASGNSCDTGDSPAHEGSVTLDTVTSTELKGSYDLVFPYATGGPTELTGTFDALQCP